MEQHKYREELQNRKISPSLDSWDRLNEKLNTHEQKGKHKKGFFLKYAAVILVFISIGFYFFQSKEVVVNTPIIVAPTLKVDLKKIPEIIEEPEIRVVTNPAVVPTKKSIKKEKKAIVKNDPVKKEAIASNDNIEATETSKKIVDETEINNSSLKEILVTETLSEEQLINNEIEQLLKNSQIKITKNRQNSVKRMVSANTLLFEVEDDLDKDLKQKLFETIVNTLKNPKEVVTVRGN